MPKGDDAPALPGMGKDDLAPHPTQIVRRAFDIYGDFAKANKWVVTTVLDEGRQKAIKKALVTYMGLDGWQRQLEKATKSDFLMGRVPPKPGFRQFKMHLDFLLQPKSIRSLIDGLYNGEADMVATSSPDAGRIRPVAMNWRAILETYRPGGRFWPAVQGRRPEEPGPHLAPEEMIAAWRQKHGVTGMVGHNGPPVESLEERLRASIEGYRRIGRYEDANRVENKLAALLGRPAVHVPSPEAATFAMPPKAAPEPTRPTVTDVPMDEPPMWEGDVPEGDPAMAEP